MNILIIQQLAWGIQIGHAVARTLQGQGHQLSTLVHGAEVRAFVEAQADVRYRHVYFADPLYDEGEIPVSPEHVGEIEERYDIPSLCRLIAGDRFLAFSFLDSRRFVARKPVSNDYILSVCWRTYQLVQEMLDHVKPDYVLAPVVASLANYLLFLECRRRGIPFFTIASARFANVFYVADDQYMGSARVRERFRELADDPVPSPKYAEARRLYDEIRQRADSARPSYMRRVARSRPTAGGYVRAVGALALMAPRLARALLRPRHVMAIRKIWMPANSRWNAARSVLVNTRERFVPTDRQRPCLRSLDQARFPYVFFPLHVEPELSLLVFAPEHTNQIELCRRVALALPRGVRLLVKEHPAMVTSRPRRFYEDLAGLVNVELIHSSVSSHDIFADARCRAVLVVSSTVGFEAAMDGRPVVSLGPTDYAVLPTVQPAASLEEAIERLRALCVGQPPPRQDAVDRANVAYLCAVLEQAIALDYMERWMSKAGSIDVEALVERIHSRLQESVS